MNFLEYSSEDIRRDSTFRRSSLHSLSMGLLGYGVDWNLHNDDPLASDSRRKGVTRSHRFNFGIKAVWHLIIQLLVDELVAEQRVEYLDRCWQLKTSQSERSSLLTTVKRLLILMG